MGTLAQGLVHLQGFSNAAFITLLVIPESPSLRTRDERDFCPHGLAAPRAPHEDLRPLCAACTSRSPLPPLCLWGLSQGSRKIFPT